jgi:pyrroline-5-carboxylate reductase
MRLTFIGNGNMAKALIKGLASTYEIEVIGRNTSSLESLKNEIKNITIKTITTPEDISDKNIILCVKPNSLNTLLLKGQANTLYSVLAGTTLETLKDNIDSKFYVRAMPNIAASYNKSMTTLTGDIKIKEDAFNIFNNIGKSLWLKTQKELDVATGLAGSGPAFLALIAEGLEDGAVNSGLSRSDSRQLVLGLFEGFSALLANDKPSDIKDKVMSPGGTTAAGYYALEKRGVRSAMIESIESAYVRTCILAKK